MIHKLKYFARLIILLFIASVYSPVNALSIDRTSEKCAEKIISYQMDGYKHLEYIPILDIYCNNLLREFKVKCGSSKKIREAQKEIRALKKSDVEGKNPFHVIEDIIRVHDTDSSDSILKKACLKMRKNHWTNLDLSAMQRCEFDENSLAITQVCYHLFPSQEERDTTKQDMILISIGGRRTGMTKVLPLGRKIHEMLQQNFNLYSLTVEAKMFDKQEDYIKWRLANTLKAVVDTLRKMNPDSKPKIVLGGYSYGGSHLIKSINQLFTRKTFEPYKPDLLLFVDPDGALNTRKHLHLVPVAKRIVNFRGIYIVPQSNIKFVRKLVSGTLDEYPSVEGTQPLVLLQKANYDEYVVYQPNNLDISPHNRVPFDIVDYRDAEGNATYIDLIEAEFRKLAEEK
jgi:hypothetical protein